MARIVDEAGVEIHPEAAGFGGELRGDVDRAMTEATAGQDREIKVRVTTDSAVAEAQLRKALSGIDAQVRGLADRIQARANLLATNMEARVVRISNKIRTETTRLRTRLTEIMTPFWARLRGELERTQRGWRAVQNVALRAADATRRGIVSSLDAASRGWRLVESGARDAFDRIGRLARPAITRVRSEIERLSYPFRVVRAYSTATFRIIRSGGAAAFRRLRAEVQPDIDLIRGAITRLGPAVTRVGGLMSRGWASASAGAGRLVAGMRSASSAVDEYEKIVKRTGLTVATAHRDMAAALDDQVSASTRLSDAGDRLVDLRDRQELAELALSRTMRESRDAADELGRAQTALTEARADDTATTEQLRELEDTVTAARERSLKATIKQREETEKLGGVAERVTEATARHHAALGELDAVTKRVERSTRLHTAALRESTTWHGRLRTAVQGTTRVLGGFGRGLGVGNRAVGAFGQRMSKAGSGTNVFSKLTRAAGVAVSGVSTIISGGTAVVRGFAGMISGTQGALSTFTDGLKGIAGGGKDVVGAVLSATLALVTMGAQMALYAVIAGAVTFAIGAVGAAIALLPGLALGAAAGIGVLLLGMDGIKKAYERGLKPALDGLKSQISTVFEQKLTPAFEKLGKTLIPAITASMKGLAGVIADGTSKLVDLVTKGENLNKINQIIRGLSGALREQVFPAVERLVQAFLDLGQVSSILRDIGGIFADLIDNTATFLNTLKTTGLAAASVSTLRTVLDSLERALFKVVEQAMRFFVGAGPGVSRAFDLIGEAIGKIDFFALGEAFGDIAQAAGEILAAVPPASWKMLADGVKEFAKRVLELAQNRSFQAFVAGAVGALGLLFEALARVVTFVQNTFEVVARVVGKGAELFGILPKGATDAALATDGALSTMPPMVQAATDGMAAAARAGAAAMVDGVRIPIAALPGITQAQFDQLPPIVRDGLIDASTQVQTGAPAIPKGFTGPMSEIPGIARDEFAKLPPQIQQQLRDAAAASRAGAAAIPPAVGDPLTAGLPPAVDSAFGGVKPSVDSHLGDAATAAAAGSATTAASVNFQPALDAANRVFGELPGAVQRGVDGAATAMDGGGRRIADSARTAFEGAARGAEAGMDRIPVAVGRAMGQAGAAAEAGADRIARSIRASLDDAARSATTAINRIPTAVTAAMGRAATETERGADRIRTVLTRSMDDSARSTEEGWQRIVRAFEEGGRRAVQVATDTGDRVVRAISSKNAAMYQAGATLIDRLAAGITSRQGAATAAAARVAAGIKAQFPSSPAKEGPLSGRGDPLRSGGEIVARLSAGITARAQMVAAALAPILRQLNSALAGAGLGAVDPAQAGRTSAAREILDAIRSGKQVFEDGSFRGMSANASRYNDDLLDAMEASGERDMRRFLERYVREQDAAAAKRRETNAELDALLTRVASAAVVPSGWVIGADGVWRQPTAYSGGRGPTGSLVSTVRDTPGPSTVRPAGEAAQAVSAADLDAMRSAVAVGIQQGIAEAMEPITPTGLARINARGQKDLLRR